MKFFFSIVLVYLIGSFPCAIVLSKLTSFPDPRTIGSGNPGATNILRVSGKKSAFFVLLGDSLKGLVSVLIARFLGVYGVDLPYIVLTVVVGHIFPLYFEFKGGKGVATMLGAFWGLSFQVGFYLTVTWLIAAYLFRYASAAALVSVIAAPVYTTMIIDVHDYLFPITLISILVVWKHRENIWNLCKGLERKLQF
ncbi:glycerol-3-phosphate 1-O-acyltransferase [Coxiella endosymbiont of Amblyomma sculptum]|uniref:glycerol-3-phosphate 1-O-acyltransferase PlsY n=1 Tax=Coxiella endosymbiont of Amblyomma sculptum TaxID=2487929 RepID=UPI00132EDF11|nr:glycerol-3-phosphate 1-O-acyltransferase [Coxiella endosymbiont of Amblyomma sculptum]